MFSHERGSQCPSRPPPTPPPRRSSTSIAALRAASENGDAGAVAELLAPDVVFHSPMTMRIRFEGRDEVAALHRDIFAVLEDLDTTEPLALGDTRSFSFRARVRGVELEAITFVRFNEQGQVVEFKVFVRPLPALATLFAALPQSGFRRGVADACGGRSRGSSPVHSPSRSARPTASLLDSSDLVPAQPATTARGTSPFPPLSA